MVHDSFYLLFYIMVLLLGYFYSYFHSYFHINTYLFTYLLYICMYLYSIYILYIFYIRIYIFLYIVYIFLCILCVGRVTKLRSSCCLVLLSIDSKAGWQDGLVFVTWPTYLYIYMYICIYMYMHIYVYVCFYMYILCRYILWTLSIHFMDFVSFINNYIPYFIVVCICIDWDFCFWSRSPYISLFFGWVLVIISHILLLVYIYLCLLDTFLFLIQFSYIFVCFSHV